MSIYLCPKSTIPGVFECSSVDSFPPKPAYLRCVNVHSGAAPLVWDRAVGWYFISLLEVIQLVPETHKGHAILVDYFTTLASALKKAQDASGGWWLIMSEPYPGMEGNYIESSASAMFTLGWLQGMRLGLLDEEEYRDAAAKAYSLLTTKFVREDDQGLLNWEGTVEVGSLSSNGTYEVSFWSKRRNCVISFCAYISPVLHQRAPGFERL